MTEAGISEQQRSAGPQSQPGSFSMELGTEEPPEVSLEDFHAQTRRAMAHYYSKITRLLKEMRFESKKNVTDPLKKEFWRRNAALLRNEWLESNALVHTGELAYEAAKAEYDYRGCSGSKEISELLLKRAAMWKDFGEALRKQRGAITGMFKLCDQALDSEGFETNRKEVEELSTALCMLVLNAAGAKSLQGEDDDSMDGQWEADGDKSSK